MITYRSREELEGKTLERGDIVVFTKEIIYAVRFRYLRTDDCLNDKIFNKLGLSKSQSYDLASQEYGYTTDHGIWPSSRDGDYPALTRLVMKIFSLLNPKITNWQQELVGMMPTP